MRQQGDGNNAPTNSYINCNSDGYSYIYSAPDSYTTNQSGSASASDSTSETLRIGENRLVSNESSLIRSGAIGVCVTVFNYLISMYTPDDNFQDSARSNTRHFVCVCRCHVSEREHYQHHSE